MVKTTLGIQRAARDRIRFIAACLATFMVVLSGAKTSSFANEGEDAPSAHPPSFQNEVMAVFSRAGCNQGACHGNRDGRGGFSLSLRGQSPDNDFVALIQEYGGRRVNLLNPSESLILLKATGEIPHQGGRRFDRDSAEYSVIEEWLASGAENVARDPVLIGMDIWLAGSSSEVSTNTPESAFAEERLVSYREDSGVWEGLHTDRLVLELGHAAEIEVRAHFSDGSEQVVNALSVFSMGGTAALTDDFGRIRGEAIGETTLLVRYLDQQLPLDIAVVPSGDFQFVAEGDQAPINSIDRFVDNKLQQLKQLPSERCDDTAFLRRAYLDLTGRLPTSKEAKRFIDNSRADKRESLIDELLARPEFAEFWALKWSDLLRNEEKVLDQTGVLAFYQWIRDAIAYDLPMNQFAHELVSSRGSTYESPPANYYRALRDPTSRGEATARLFLGVRLQCARCHNHPFEVWSQDDYYSWAAVFANVEYEIIENNRRDKYDKNEFKGEQLVTIGTEGIVRNPDTRIVAEPRFLAGPAVTDETELDRLQQLADWLTRDENRRFAEVQANFVWYQLMGQGLVDPLDDFRTTNQPSNQELLSYLADQFVESGYQPKQLIREIMSSRSYQIGDHFNETNQHDERNYARSLPRRLSAEQLLDAQNQVLGTRSAFAVYPDITRAVALPGAQVRRPADGDRFLMKFGKPTRLLGCECERSNETTLDQVLELVSGEGLQNRLSDHSNVLGLWLEEERSTDAIINELFWRALSRPPEEVERLTATDWIDNAEEKRIALEDLAWSLLNAKEFVFRR